MATTRRKFEAMIRREAEAAAQLLAKKGLDYDEANDVTARVREDAKDLGITPEQCVFAHFKKHIAALERWVRDGEVDTQSPQERIRDAMAYLYLALALLEEDSK